MFTTTQIMARCPLPAPASLGGKSRPGSRFPPDPVIFFGGRFRDRCVSPDIDAVSLADWKSESPPRVGKNMHLLFSWLAKKQKIDEMDKFALPTGSVGRFRQSENIFPPPEKKKKKLFFSVVPWPNINPSNFGSWIYILPLPSFALTRHVALPPASILGPQPVHSRLFSSFSLPLSAKDAEIIKGSPVLNIGISYHTPFFR